MKLKLYNTLTRQKEEFIPLMEDPDYKGPKKDFVGIYSCGPTVYGMPHFGNIRAAFTADLIRNVIQIILGYKTISVMNITDVGHLVGDSDDGEEKMEKAARNEGLSAWDVAKKYENIYLDFFKNLHIDPFTVMPRATEHIKEQIELVKTLEEKGYTYIVEGDGIYMDTSKVADYGKLIGPNYKKHLEGIRSGERVDLKGKRNATDFALWKFHIGGGKRDMERNSPWGIGFPGRHAECSAMSSKYLGEQFDIHHGGYDLIPVHHTNEITQSECASGKSPWVKYWLHNQFVLMNGKKMSKSDGNTVSPFEVIERGYSYMDMRYFFFTAHYRTFFDFTWDSMETTKRARENFIKKIGYNEDEENLLSEEISFVAIEKKLQTIEGKAFWHGIMEALCDDLNTVKVISLINSSLPNKNIEIKSMIYRLSKNFIKVGRYIEEEVTETIKISDEITEMAEQRKQAKLDKNYALADELRNKIKNMGYEIKDIKEEPGYEISKI